LKGGKGDRIWLGFTILTQKGKKKGHQWQVVGVKKGEKVSRLRPYSELLGEEKKEVLSFFAEISQERGGNGDRPITPSSWRAGEKEGGDHIIIILAKEKRDKAPYSIQPRIAGRKKKRECPVVALSKVRRKKRG